MVIPEPKAAHALHTLRFAFNLHFGKINVKKFK